MEETKPLFRLLRTEAFRFIIVRYNHYSLVTRLKGDLLQHFPERPQNTIDARNADYRLLVDSYYKAEKGFFFVENFEEILTKPEIYSGLNQRRDKLAMYPIALIAFLSSSTDELYARQIMEKMPDLWSFRSLMLDLKVDISNPFQTENWNQSFVSEQVTTTTTTTLGGNTPDEKEQELKRLLKRVSEVQDSELNLLTILYQQIAKILRDLWRHEEAIEYYFKLEKVEITIGDKAGLATTYYYIGAIYSDISKWDKSLYYYIKSEVIFEEIGDFASLGRMYNNIGTIYKNMGEWDEALLFYLKSEKIRNQISDKPGLGPTFNNIGEIYRKKGEWNLALEYYLKSETIQKEFADKLGLGFIYSNIGIIYSNKNDWEKALEYNLKAERIRNEIGDKSGLGTTYNNFGAIYAYIGEWDKALEYYIKSEKIYQEIGDQFGLAASYNNIGGFYSKRDLWGKALEYYMKSEVICKEIGDLPSLAFTYFNIGNGFKKNGDGKHGNDYIILAGFIAINQGMKGELSQMAWALDPIIQELGQEKFMEEGQKLYDQIVNQKNES